MWLVSPVSNIPVSSVLCGLRKCTDTGTLDRARICASRVVFNFSSPHPCPSRKVELVWQFEQRCMQRLPTFGQSCDRGQAVSFGAAEQNELSLLCLVPHRDIFSYRQSSHHTSDCDELWNSRAIDSNQCTSLLQGRLWPCLQTKHSIKQYRQTGAAVRERGRGSQSLGTRRSTHQPRHRQSIDTYTRTTE